MVGGVLVAGKCLMSIKKECENAAALSHSRKVQCWIRF